MSRSNYQDGSDMETWELVRWRGAVAKATKGARGQQMLRELLVALDAMPEKRLIKESLEYGAEVCALGCLGRAKGLDMSKLDPENYDAVAKAFGIAPALTQEIVWMNDEYDENETPEQCWTRMRQWVSSQIVL